MARSKHTWKGLFYDYHSRIYHVPMIHERESGIRGTTASGSASSISEERSNRNVSVRKVYAQEIANPGWTRDLKTKLNCKSLEFRFGCQVYDHPDSLSLFTYDVDHSYVVLMICVPGSPGAALRMVSLKSFGLQQFNCGDRRFITANVTRIIQCVYPKYQSKTRLVWR